MGWTSLPALQVSSAPAYLITIESHKDIYPVYHYSIQMSDHSSKFKGYHNLNKLSLLDDIPVAPLHTCTFMCLYRWHTSTAHTHTATSTHSEIMSSSTSVNERKVSIPGTSGNSCRLLGDGSTISKARLMCLKKECEPGMCLDTDMASGEPIAAKADGALGGL